MVNPFIPLIQSYLPEPESSLLVGMIFGGKLGFPQEFYQALLTTGTIHVVALSGSNISILVNVVAKATYFLGRKLSSVISVLVILAFIIFVGPSATIIRAGLMGAVTLLAVYFGRQTSVLLSLVFAGFIMIIISPRIVTDLSFQLSFLATLGIIVFAPTASKSTPLRCLSISGLWLKIKEVFWENLKTTLSAQVATLPVIVFVFGRVSLVSPLTNVLVGWTVNPIMIMGLIICLVGVVFYPLGQIISWFVYIFLYYFVSMVEITSKIPYANLVIK